MMIFREALIHFGCYIATRSGRGTIITNSNCVVFGVQFVFLHFLVICLFVCAFKRQSISAQAIARCGPFKHWHDKRGDGLAKLSRLAKRLTGYRQPRCSRTRTDHLHSPSQPVQQQLFLALSTRPALALTVHGQRSGRHSGHICELSTLPTCCRPERHGN